jgi:hypothetical protein
MKTFLDDASSGSPGVSAARPRWLLDVQRFAFVGSGA